MPEIRNQNGFHPGGGGYSVDFFKSEAQTLQYVPQPHGLSEDGFCQESEGAESSAEEGQEPDAGNLEI